MKTASLSAIRRFEIRDIEPPRLQRGDEVLLRVAMVGICGSDIHYFNNGRIGDQVVSYPFTIGHECSAVVAEVGPQVVRCRPGNRVFVEPAVFCGECDQCRLGRRHTCRQLQFLGCPGQLPGALSDYIVMPEENCYPLPPELSLDQAVLAEPLSIAMHALRQAGSISGKTMAILGAGPIGLSVLLTVRAATDRPIFVTDKIAARLEAATNAGAEWSGNPNGMDVQAEILKRQPLGVDVVFECCGEQEALDQAVNVLAPGGILVLVGIPAGDRVYFDISRIRRKELSVVNVRRQNHCVVPALDFLSAHTAALKFMITHRFAFNEITAAFDLVGAYKDGVIKAVINMGSDQINS